MARRKSTPPRALKHHWYLPEWAAQYGKRQVDAQAELGWSKSMASYLWNGKQRYTEDLIDEVSQWLNIKPYELLMHPEDAARLWRLRQTAVEIVRELPPANIPEAPEPKRTGTDR